MSKYFPTLANLWNWWIAQLLACLPYSVRRLLFRRKIVLVKKQDTGFEFYLDYETPGPTTFGGDQNNPQFDRRKSISSGKARRLARSGAAVVLLLARREILSKAIKLPAVARANFRDVVGFEMDRLTPFKADDVYFDCWLQTRDDSASQNEGDQISIDLLVVPKAVVEPYIFDLARLHLTVARIGAAETDPQILHSAISISQKYRRIVRVRHIVNTLLFTVVIALAATSIYFDFRDRRATIDELAGRVLVMRDRAIETNQMRDRLNQLTQRIAVPSEVRTKNRRQTDVLNRITAILPDDTYLDRLQVEEGKLSLSGYSENASTLIGRFNKSGLFRNVRFASPVVSDRRTGRDRFNISADFSGSAE